MNKFVSILIVSVMFCLGCATLQENAGRTLASIEISVDATMRVWYTLLVNNQVTIEQDKEVRNLYARYQSAMDLLVDAYKVGLEKSDKSTWQITLSIALACKQDLLNLIETFKKPI